MESPREQDSPLSQADLVNLGRVIKVRGTGGEVVVKLLCDYPQRFVEAERVFVVGSDPLRALHVKAAAALRDGARVTFDEISDREEAEKLVGTYLAVPKAEVPPAPQGSIREFELLDMDVITVSGESLGKVVEVFSTGSNDVYVVRSEGKEYLIPATEEVIRFIDRAERRILIDPLPGLLDL